MEMNDKEITRAKILGALIRDAREHAGRSQQELAQALNIADERVVAAELGEYVFSLPDLEVVSIFCGVPLSHFWGTRVLNGKQDVNFQLLAQLRQRVIGAQIQQLRVAHDLDAAGLSQATGIPVETLATYERGDRPVPLFHLEKLGSALEVSLDHFIDTHHGPLARHELERKLAQRLAEMPVEMRAFVAEPINGAYLETAMHLSEMDAAKLRTIAESLLEITF